MWFQTSIYAAFVDISIFRYFDIWNHIFLFYGVVSVPRCDPPYKHRKILESNIVQTDGSCASITGGGAGCGAASQRDGRGHACAARGTNAAT